MLNEEIREVVDKAALLAKCENGVDSLLSNLKDLSKIIALAKIGEIPGLIKELDGIPKDIAAIDRVLYEKNETLANLVEAVEFCEVCDNIISKEEESEAWFTSHICKECAKRISEDAEDEEEEEAERAIPIDIEYSKENTAKLCEAVEAMEAADRAINSIDFSVIDQGSLIGASQTMKCNIANIKSRYADMAEYTNYYSE